MTRTVRGPLLHIPFEKIAREILGGGYALSLVLCADTLARRINHAYRLPALKLRQAGKKNYSPNVLSFPLEKREGEIFLNVRKAEREARAMAAAPKDRIAHLFVHGCLHLKGLAHGARMEELETRTLKKFGYAAPYRS